MKKNHKGKILNIETVAKDMVKMQFATELESILPGQFVSILIPNKTLRRPFSVANHDIIDYLAPLGNTFSLANSGEKALLIGAGIGIAPMLYLNKTLRQNGAETFLISGFRNEEEAINGSDKTVIGGSVLDNIQNIIDEFKPEIIYSCGPKIVLQMVCDIAKRNGIKAEIAMEKVMACGIGVCRGCVIKLNGKEGVKNASVCADGPVFNGAEVIWED